MSHAVFDETILHSENGTLRIDNLDPDVEVKGAV